ncbi:hypothetical protein Noca_3689 [Nocardioides sp. JS614]|nr:hypothetical protein Noca_3689 [Nocardioides sp. JS614]
MAGVPRVRTTSLIAALVVEGLAATLLLAGCGTDSDGPEAAEPAATPSARATVSEQPSATAAPSAPEPTAATRATRKPRGHKVGTLQPRARATTTEHLLDADRLPTVGDRAWAVDTTGPEDPERDPAVGACQKTLLGTIGAVETVRRTFTAADRVTATQVVARFADSRSAWRAHRVLVAWRDDCAERVDRADVGPLEPVTVRTGTAESYRTAARKRAAGLGILRTGSYLTVVEVTARAERYPDSWDPARVALRRVARTF